LRYAANVANEASPDSQNAWGASELCSLRTIAGGHGNPPRVPIQNEARGILLSLFAMGAEASALERLDEKRRAICAKAWQSLLAATEVERGQLLAELRAEATSALPRGLERLHPSWILAALEDEPAHIVRLVLPGLPETTRAAVLRLPVIASVAPQPGEEMRACSESTKRAVERVAFGWLAPLCESDCGALAESLLGLAFDGLLTEVTRRGARAVGQSLAGAAPALRARAMAAAGEPWAQVIGAASAESVAVADRKVAMSYANMQIPDSARTTSERLVHIGLAVLKSELAADHAGSIYRVAGRLPATLGRPLLGWTRR
jgi:hypothetical protein